MGLRAEKEQAIAEDEGWDRVDAVALCFARAVGEYGSVIFISSGIPGKGQIVPMQIMAKLDDFRYSEATAIGVVLLSISLLILLFINGIEWWSRRRERGVGHGRGR